MLLTDAQYLCAQVKGCLDSMGFDVILEDKPPHLHVEFDPKGSEQMLVRLAE